MLALPTSPIGVGSSVVLRLLGGMLLLYAGRDLLRVHLLDLRFVSKEEGFAADAVGDDGEEDFSSLEDAPVDDDRERVAERTSERLMFRSLSKTGTSSRCSVNLELTILV